MTSPPDRESPSDFDSVSAKDVPEEQPPSAATSSTSGDASGSVSLEEQPSATSAPSTSGTKEPSNDDASSSDCGDSSGNSEDSESDDDDGYLGDKESLSVLAAEYKSGNVIELLQDKYSRFRSAKGDENCFYRSFMFAYLEHLLETQDKAQFDSAIEKVEKCRNTLKFEAPDYIAEDYFMVFLTMLDCIRTGNLSHEELLWKSNNRYVSNYLVFFLKIVVSVELRSKGEFYEPFIAGFEKLKLEKFCKSSVELMGECDQVRIKALTDALGVPLRIEHVESSDYSIIPQMQHHDYQPSASCIDVAGITSPCSSSVTHQHQAAADRPASITLLHRCGRYYILYP